MDTALIDGTYNTNIITNSPFIIIRFQVFFLFLAISALFSNDVIKYPSTSLSPSTPSFIFFNIIINYGVLFYVKTYSILLFTRYINKVIA